MDTTGGNPDITPPLPEGVSHTVTVPPGRGGGRSGGPSGQTIWSIFKWLFSCTKQILCFSLEYQSLFGADVMISNESDIENVLLCYPLRPDSCPRAPRLTILRVAMYVLMVLMILTTVFGNLLIIISISHFKHLQSPTHMIVQSLAACDCLLGSLVMPYSMVRSVEGCWYLGDFVCKVHSSLDMTFSISSLMHLSLISVDRYWAICDHLRYKMRVTNNTVTVFTTLTWLFSFLYSFSIVFSGVNKIGLESFIIQVYCVGSFVF